MVVDPKISAIMTVVSNVVLEKETLRKTVNEQREPPVNCVLNAVNEDLLAEMLARDGKGQIDPSVLNAVNEDLLAEMLARDGKGQIDPSVLNVVDEGLLAEMLARDGQDMIEPSVLNAALEVTRVVAVIGVGEADEC